MKNKNYLKIIKIKKIVSIINKKKTHKIDKIIVRINEYFLMWNIDTTNPLMCLYLPNMIISQMAIAKLIENLVKLI